MRFVLCDRLVEIYDGKSAVFQKNVTQAEDYFIDHFPGYPIVPGSVILGSLEQGAEIFLAASSGFTVRPILKTVRRAVFKRPLVPGDRLGIFVRSVSGSPGSVEAAGEVEGECVAEAFLNYDLISLHKNADTAEACARLKALYEIMAVNPVERVQDLWGKK